MAVYPWSGSFSIVIVMSLASYWVCADWLVTEVRKVWSVWLEATAAAYVVLAVLVLGCCPWAMLVMGFALVVPGEGVRCCARL